MKKLKAEAVKAKKKFDAAHKGKQVRYIPHPTVPNTLIEEAVL